MRTAERRGSDARASLAWSTLIWRSRAATSDHRGWTRATRVRSTTAIRGALAARASGGNPGAGFAVIARPEQPARRTASAAQTSGRVISEPSLPADRLDDLIGQIDPAVQDDVAAQHDRNALRSRDLLDGGADVFLEGGDQLLALLHEILVDLVPGLRLLVRGHRLHALLRVGDLGLRVVLQGRLRARLLRMAFNRLGHIHVPDREGLPQGRSRSGRDESRSGEHDDHRRRDADASGVPPHDAGPSLTLKLRPGGNPQLRPLGADPVVEPERPDGGFDLDAEADILLEPQLGSRRLGVSRLDEHDAGDPAEAVQQRQLADREPILRLREGHLVPAKAAGHVPPQRGLAPEVELLLNRQRGGGIPEMHASDQRVRGRDRDEVGVVELVLLERERPAEHLEGELADELEVVPGDRKSVV